MKKLSEYEGEDAIGLLGDIIVPVVDIFQEESVREALSNNGDRIIAVRDAIKNHKDSVIELMAILEGVPREELKINIFTLPQMVLEIFNDEELLSFFKSQVQKMGDASFGSAMETTEDEKK